MQKIVLVFIKVATLMNAIVGLSMAYSVKDFESRLKDYDRSESLLNRRIEDVKAQIRERELRKQEESRILTWRPISGVK